MLQPIKVKHRKVMKGKRKGKATRGNTVVFGDYGVISLECGWIRSNQIEAARITITRKLSNKKLIWIRLFPDKPITTKPIETRMGKGKGAPEYWVDVVKPGKVLFEIAGVTSEEAKKIFKSVGHKLPVKVKMVARKGVII